MSGAQKVHDHKTWVGSDKGELPMGNKIKTYTSAEGVGEQGEYEDKTEDIKGVQEKNRGKVKGHANPNDRRQ